ncbi:type II toxin-antitoxin system VapC family toxin [Reyranella sp.]|uniref:type II toxin-antitoxin system VapC family toxin n=1 Tax=Reyranella sp. TaxID=1929291 RepID=UPI003BAB3589
MDSSALLAILLNEPDRQRYADALLAVDGAQIGAPNYFEASMVAESQQGPSGCRDLDQLAAVAGLSVVPFDAVHVDAAREAFRRYGEGRHRAALTFGDCCAYALARTLDWPLLFKGDDFALTDLKRAL